MIEIKRSYQIDEKSLEQAYEYQAFIKEKYATDTSISNVVCYIIGGTKKDDFKTRNKLLTYQTAGDQCPGRRPALVGVLQPGQRARPRKPCRRWAGRN